MDPTLSAPAADLIPTSPHTHRTPLRDTFSSLRIRNYRLFASGQLVSNTGAWVQRIAQDWLVLTLTGSATAVGITTALQFLPTLLFGLHGGLLADRYSKRAILLCTQVGMATMAGILAALTLSHSIQAWHVYLVAFGLGLVSALDNPTRQSFVNEMVGGAHLRNAISLNASVFQLGAMIGPAISGYLLVAVGAGYAFAINAISYVAPCIALVMIDARALHRTGLTRAADGHLADAVHEVRRRPELLWPTLLVGAFGLFTINLPVTLAAYAKTQFATGAGGYGLLSSAVALGSVIGALISARRDRTRLRGLLGIAAGLCAISVLAAATPQQWAYLLLLVGVGAGTLMLQTSANATVQLAAGDAMRGRVMGVYLLVFIGSGAIGGPLLGALDQHFGPRLGMLLAGVVPAVATTAIAWRLARSGRFTLGIRRTDVSISVPMLSVVHR